MIFLRRIFIIYLSSRYSVIFLRFTSQLLSFCDLWSECGSEVTGLRKIIWDLLFLSYSSNLMFVAIVPTALALIIFVSLSWVKNWAIKSQCDKNKGIYPWFKLDETCVTTIAKCTILLTYHSYGVVHILRCQDFGTFWPPTHDTIRENLHTDDISRTIYLPRLVNLVCECPLRVWQTCILIDKYVYILFCKRLSKNVNTTWICKMQIKKVCCFYLSCKNLLQMIYFCNKTALTPTAS